MLNQYPLWKYLLILAVVVLGFIYALPNFYGEDPAIQISAARGTKLDNAAVARVEAILKRANVTYASAALDEGGVKVRFADTETQLKARDTVQRELGNSYTVALNLLPATPAWLQAINARPMYLGLDLSGGVHFLLQVDMDAAIKKAEERYVEDIRGLLRNKNIRYLTVARLDAGGVEIRFRDVPERDKARDLLRRELADLTLLEQERNGEFVISGKLTEAALREKRKFALDQNLTALNNRVNELGVAEPIIQQQGADRIVVQLPGVQDTARAKEILGRTATLEIMLVDEQNDVAGALGGRVPPGSKLYHDRQKRPILLKKQVIYSGDNIVDAAAGFDNQQGGAVVHISLDARGAAINQRVTGENVGKRMAVVYIEIKSETQLDADGKPVLDPDGRPVQIKSRIEEVITAPVIREQLGKRFQISGLEGVEEARDLSLLLRAGALAAPVFIVEERTVGPSLGADNIQRGFHSTWIGFAAIALFMMVYYLMFGAISVAALGINVLLLVALLSMLQATLTLPGMAAIALTVGMAIDANVLINERIREELRNGNTPQASIHAGYERAFGTILDSNLTSLIAGLALFLFGSGPVRGFAVVLCLGILTSMFSAVMVSRAMVNRLYGGRRKLERVSIGNTAWKHGQAHG
ncbi:MAG: protein-export membrane protein SecD [Candidatus Muproteobacteria bacterium RBG_16_64_11]|uniref:Protein translocase subunit SecD n=1 Tax=Candidatus Muproteobacteria bacterium RBG_16_64_11 TaxID=1817758 RepID=A0A1F6TI55_9PROT|nr:MAG: protein-export membrane protein SecD [Candidatus Muproteobacteria bacterium RBG_16_64_11]